MSWGLVSRADDRGLGTLLWEAYRHLHPDRTLVVREPGAEHAGFEPHPERYPDGLVVHYEQGFDEGVVRGWLEGLDVVYGAETWYEKRFPDWCAEADVRTVIHSMPEFWHSTMRADRVWAPTSWRLDTLPPGTPIVPVPVVSRPPQALWDGTRPLSVVHVAGHPAAYDRNGTRTYMTAVSLSHGPMTARLCIQKEQPLKLRTLAGVEVDLRIGSVDDRWSMYDGADLLVMPRAYGGLSLPVLEAMACGLGIVMTDCAPNRDWPILPIRCRQRGRIHTPAGPVPMFSADSALLARTLDDLAGDVERVRGLQRAARDYAAGHSWDVLEPVYRMRLADACL